MPSARVESIPQALGKDVAPRVFRPFSPSFWWDYFRQMISLGSFWATGIVVCPLSTVALAIFGDRIPATFGQEMIRWLFSTWLKFSEKIGVFEVTFPDAERLKGLTGAIVAPNHPSEMDAVLLLIAVPRAVCIVRASLMKSLFLGGGARMARYVSNDQGPALIRQGVEKLREGENLLIFPEGTRSNGQAVNAFKHGFALIATKTFAPIQTIFIERENRYLAKGVSALEPTPLPIRLRVHIGEQMVAEEGERAQDLSKRLEIYFRSHLECVGDHILLKKPAQP